MARTQTVEQAAALAGRRRKEFFRVFVENADGDYVDFTNLGGRSWVHSADIDVDLDAPISQATVRFGRDNGSTQSLSPTRSDSILNRDGFGEFATALDVGRRFYIEVAVLDPSVAVAPAAGDWVRLWEGITDTVDPAGAQIVVVGRDPGGRLADAWLPGDTALVVSGDPPMSLEDAIQALIDIAIPSFGPGSDPITLYTPVPSDVGVTQFGYHREPLMDAIQRLVETFGWSCRYLWDSTTSSFRLTLFKVDRAKVVPDLVLGPNRYSAIRQLTISRLSVRNRVTLSFTNSFAAGGPARDLVRVEDVPSQFKYGGIRPIVIDEASDSPINSRDEALAMATALLSDLKDPKADQSTEMPLLWPVEMSDLVRFSPNGAHYNTDQDLAVTSIRHSLAADKMCTTSLQLRGSPAGAYRSWIYRARRSTIPTTTEPATPQLLGFAWTDGDSARTYEWTRNDTVDAVWVYDRLVPVGAALWPSEGTLPTAVLVTGTDAYVALKPPAGYQRVVQLEPRTAAGAAGDVRREVIDPVPSALAAKIRPTVTNDTADLSLEIAGSSSNWPVKADVYEDDPDGLPIYSTTVSGAAVITKLTAGAAALGARALPLRALRRWYLKLTDVAGVMVWGVGAADRDALPSGDVTATDFRAAPSFACTYDDDTDVIRITVPGGKTKTFAGLTGGGVKTYTVGDALDDASTEATFTRDETRAGYLVEFQGGGQWRTFWTGALHGAPAAGPSLTASIVHDALHGTIDYVGVGGAVELSTNGGASWSAAPASPIVVNRTALAQEYTLRMIANGQTVTNSLTVLSLNADKDTVTPELTVTPSAPTDTTQDFTATALNPTGGAAPALYVIVRGTTAVASGGIGALADGAVNLIPSGTVVTVNRAPFGTAAQVSIEFYAELPGSARERIQRTILNQVKTSFGPSVDLRTTISSTQGTIVYTNTGTLELSIDGGSWNPAPASPIIVTRDGGDHRYDFRATLDSQVVAASASIPALPPAGSVPAFGSMASPANNVTNQYAFSWTCSDASLPITLNVDEGNGAGYQQVFLPAGTTSYNYNSAYDLVSGAPNFTMKWYLEATSGDTVRGTSVVKSYPWAHA